MSESQSSGQRKVTGSLSPPKAVQSNPVPRRSTQRRAATPAVNRMVDDRELEYRTPSDKALLEGWRRYRAYSEASKRQKNLYSDLRSWIIRLTLLASTLAALATLPFVVENNLIANIFRVALIAMPILVAGAMTYANEFTPNSAWITYRVAAQQILHEMYRYRAQSGKYSDPTLNAGERQQLFLERITQRVKDVTQTLTSEEAATIEPVLMEYEDEGEIAKYAATKRSGNGFSPFTAEQYIDMRLISQRNWYIRKLQEDYKKLRRARFAILLFSGAGAIIAGIDIHWAFLVVITTALVTAITTWMQLEMQGQTYGHYTLTANLLDEIHAAWDVLSDQQQHSPQALSKLVIDVEKVLEDEELAWMQQAIQSQMLAQQSMERTLSSISGSRNNYDDDEDYAWSRIRSSLDESYAALSVPGAVIRPGVDDDDADMSAVSDVTAPIDPISFG